jgi:dTDP-4-amino-4,6-dideoxygalactose transaminase
MPLITRTRQAVGRRYNERLSRIPAIRVPQSDFTDVTPFLYYLRVPEDRRDALRAYLAERGIDTGIHWQPGHWFTLLQDCRRGDLGVTDRVGREILSLPLHSAMRPEAVEAVCDGIESFFASAGRRAALPRQPGRTRNLRKTGPWGP